MMCLIVFKIADSIQLINGVDFNGDKKQLFGYQILGQELQTDTKYPPRPNSRSGAV